MGSADARRRTDQGSLQQWLPQWQQQVPPPPLYHNGAEQN